MSHRSKQRPHKKQRFQPPTVALAEKGSDSSSRKTTDSSTWEKLKDLVDSDFLKLQEERKKLEYENAEFVEMKEKYSSISFPKTIKLDVGGYQFKTSLSTLRKEESVLSEMFSGKGYKVEQDEDGYYFIDRPGKYFAPILHYLQTGSYIPPNSPQKVNAILKEAQFYQIKSLIPVQRYFKNDNYTTGLLYWLGTRMETCKYQNPFSIGTVKVSGDTTNPTSAVDDATQNPADAGGCKWGQKEIIIELLDVVVKPNSYSLSYAQTCNKPDAWRLEALDLKTEQWKTISNHDQECLDQRKNWEILSSDYYSTFKLVKSLVNLYSYSRANCFHVCHFEIYGDVKRKI